MKNQGKRVTRARLICVNSIERGKYDISENNCATAVTNPPLPTQGSPVQLLTGLQVRNKGFPVLRLLMRHNLWPCFFTLLRSTFHYSKRVTDFIHFTRKSNRLLKLNAAIEVYSLKKNFCVFIGFSGVWISPNNNANNVVATLYSIQDL